MDEETALELIQEGERKAESLVRQLEHAHRRMEAQGATIKRLELDVEHAKGETTKATHRAEDAERELNSLDYVRVRRSLVTSMCNMAEMLSDITKRLQVIAGPDERFKLIGDPVFWPKALKEAS